jgi:hypothetical protein
MKNLITAARRHRSLFPLFVVMMFVSVAMTSCDDDYYPDYYGSPIVGTWQLTGVPGFDVTEFDFYDDGTGYYYAYDSYGTWTSWPITYNIYGSRLTVYVSTGQIWNYTWRCSGTMLILQDLDVYGNTLYFQYVY